MPPEPSPSKIGKSVGEKIRAERVALHYTQSKLASPDFSVSYISAIERGQIHPSLRAMEIFAARLGIPVTHLLPQPTTQDSQQQTQMQPTEREVNESDTTLLTAHVLISQNETTRALALLEKTATKRFKHPQQLWRRYLLGYAYLVAQQPKPAAHIFSELIDMLDTIKATANYYLYTHILFMLGNSYAALHEPVEALRIHQRCLQKLEEGSVHDTFLIAQTYLQLGVHSTQLNQNLDATTMFHKSIETFEYISTREQVLATCASLMQHAISYHDYYAAELYAYRAQLFSALAENRVAKSEAFYYLSKITLEENPEEALVHLSALLDQERANVLVQATINARIAEWHFAYGDREEALVYARIALQFAKPFGNTLILADAFLTLGQIEYTLGLFNESDEHYDQGITLLEELKSLDLHKYLLQYAQRLEERGQVENAFKYFIRAYKSSV